MDKYRCTRPLLPVLSLVMIFFHLSNSAFAVPPSQPATIVIEREGIEGQLKEMPDVIVLPVLVEFTRDVQSIELIVLQSRLVKDPFLKEKNTIFKEKLTHGKEAEIAFSIPIEIIEPGHYEIDIRLSGYVDKHNGFSDRKILHILVDKEGIFRFLTGAQYIREKRLLEKNQFDQRFKKNEASPNMCLLSDETIQVPDDIAKKIKPFDIPTDEQMQADPAIPSELTREYVIDKSHERFTSKGTGTITVRGRLAYLDYNGDLRPLVNVSVYCYDEEDLRPDEYLGATRTNWNGEWSFIDINNDDGWLEDGRDIYYTFKLENTRIRVQDCDWIDETYAWRSEQHDNVADGTVLDFGMDTATIDHKVLRIWSYLNIAWNHAVTAGGKDPGFVDSCYPYDGTHWDQFWEEIAIDEEYDDGPDVVSHEYGHAVMHMAYGGKIPGTGGPHSFDDCPQNAALAWSEGWASGFALSIRPDGEFNWHEGQYGRNIENFYTSCQTGNLNEGRVAAAINDMLDTPNDCNDSDSNYGRIGYCDLNEQNRVSLSNMLRDTLWGSRHDSFINFWNDLSLTPSKEYLAHIIMYYNWIDVTVPVLDSDGDDLTDYEEIYIYGTNPNNPDTDGDGLTDGDEINTYGTDPAISDTDGDGVDDKNDIFPLDPLRWTHDITPIIMPLLLSPIVEVENVNSYLSGTPDPSTFSFDPTPVSEGSAGTFYFTADFCNIGDKTLLGLKSVTVRFSGNNALLNRDSGTPPGVGSELTFPKTGGLADSKLEPCECVRVDYKIGMEKRIPFQFFTDVFGFKQ